MYEYRIAKSKNGEYMLRNGMFLADRYEILEQIGTGGMSDVYKAKCHKLNRFVAIKVLKNEFSQDKTFVTKFRAEAQSAAGLTHPNIVSVYDVGDEDGIYYIVMELVEGITLKKYIEKYQSVLDLIFYTDNKSFIRLSKSNLKILSELGINLMISFH